MLEVELRFDDIYISSIKKENLLQIQKWMTMQKQFVDDDMGLKELEERFLESYISECEFFLKIDKKNELIGIIKGRMEFKNPNEVWIWSFYIDDKYKNTTINSETIKQLLNYFSKGYGIDIFYTRIIKNDRDSLLFWKIMGYKPVRVVKDFYSINDKYMDMLIMKKQ
ncbi:GNAT family N-acetyltransferase [Clostridium thailandense]|uniref:GNAT family N-acetyltransferase n=1 Tax=Clostridium thailandense TaxID=2794346 RepID=A0A949WQR3_9CLOT|nr:GNAT family N-acetyltransferase [Clostridium thailandense]MBV7273081.1 GNAT family N-acetyltransferase [Clostridium thailandense]MCH5135745.1 GNAT family N-acetyltransferase [Clostridiaceae bacterium UIB06]